MKEQYREVTFITDPAYVDLFADYIGTLSDEAIEYGDDRIILRSEKETGPVTEAVET